MSHLSFCIKELTFLIFLMNGWPSHLKETLMEWWIIFWIVNKKKVTKQDSHQSSLKQLFLNAPITATFAPVVALARHREPSVPSASASCPSAWKTEHRGLKVVSASEHTRPRSSAQPRCQHHPALDPVPFRATQRPPQWWVICCISNSSFGNFPFGGQFPRGWPTRPRK